MALFGWLAVKGPGPVSIDDYLQRSATDSTARVVVPISVSFLYD